MSQIVDLDQLYIIRESSIRNMKYLVYVITFFGYCTLHMMRMSLPFVQMDLQNFFSINNLQMGIANGVLYIVIGLSCMWVTLSPVRNPQYHYFYAMMIASLCYLLIPLLVYLNVKIPLIYYISLAGFGWFQGPAWPILLALINVFFKSKQDGCLVGLWSANKDSGNILGFLVCTIVIIFMKLPFQIGLMVPGVLSVVFTILVFTVDIGNAKEQIEEEKNENVLQEYKKIVTDKFIVFMLIMVCMMKAIIYGILLWLPMYFDKYGFKEYQGYIPIAMNMMGILGSSALGLVYQKIHNPVVKSIIILISLIIPVLSLITISKIQFTVENKLILLILIGIIGFCISGNYNILIANEVNLACDRLNINVIVFSGVSMGLGSIFVGITEIIIGKLATSDSNSVFMIFLVMAFMLVGFEIVREMIMYYTSKADELKQNSINGNELNKDNAFETGPYQQLREEH